MAEAEEEAVLQRLAGLLRPLGGVPGGLEHVARRAVDVDAAHAGPRSCASECSCASSTSRCRSATASETSPTHPGARHVGPAARRLVLRPQVEADRCVRGQRPAAGVVADGVAGAHRRHDDVVGSRRAQARAHLGARGSAALGGEHLARRSAGRRRSTSASRSTRAALLDTPATAACGGAADAGQLGVASCGAGARRRARRRASARRPRRAGDRRPRAGSRAAPRRCAIPSSRTARTYSSRSIASQDSPAAMSSSRPNCSPSMRSSSGACARDAVDLEHVGEDDPAAIGLEVEERVADRERHLVAQLGRAQRVADG